MADIQMSFPAMALLARGGVENLPHLTQWVQRVEQRPAWQKAVERGGRSPYPANKLLLKPMTGKIAISAIKKCYRIAHGR